MRKTAHTTWHGHLAHEFHGHPARETFSNQQGQDGPATHGQDARATAGLGFRARSATAMKNRGSVILMSIGLLTVIAMLGATFLVIAHMDRKQNRALANAAPITMRSVARNELTGICADRLADLHIGANGPYAAAATVNDTIDYPHEDVDAALACIEPYLDGAVWRWRYISNPGSAHAAGNVTDVAITGANLVDTDGDAVKDSLHWDTGIRDGENRQYYVAVRLIDASGLINVNTAYAPAAAAANTPMPVTNVSLAALLGDAVRDSLHVERRGNTSVVNPVTFADVAVYNAGYATRPLNPNPPAGQAFTPFGTPDLLAMAWRGNTPNTACDRLYSTLTDPNVCVYLTTWSAVRDYPRVSSADLPHRVNPNTATQDELYNAFYAAIGEVTGMFADDDARKIAAAQLAVNVIDYVDTNSDVSTRDVAGTTVFGIERQPFITEAWLRRIWVDDGGAGYVSQMSAIELYNPYPDAVSLSGLHLQVGAGAPVDISGSVPASIGPGQRITLVSDDTNTRGQNKYEVTTLDLQQTCILLQPTSVAGKYVAIGESPGFTVGDVGAAVLDVTDPGPYAATKQRDDNAARAKYSVAVYDTIATSYCIGDPTCPATDADSDLGSANTHFTEVNIDVAPTPVFVRNGPMINLGDMLRVFYVGPTNSQPLDVRLAGMTADSEFNGRLNTKGEVATAVGLIPALPSACMLGDYFNALAPSSANTGGTDTIYGQININTAPGAVLACLPGISPLANRDTVASDIVAYRDLIDNGGTNYSGASARATATSITGLRDGPGFASSGEIAIPIRTLLPSANNTWGGTAPNAYEVSDGASSDDGLARIDADSSKYELYYAWLSNQVTVRSDVYVAYIWVAVVEDGQPVDPDATIGVERYIAVIDRSNCQADGDVPEILLFTALR